MAYIRLIFCLISCCLFASCGDDDVIGERVKIENDLPFSVTFGGAANDEAVSLIELDNFIYTFGHSTSFGDSQGDFYLIKTDLEGNKSWEKTYGKGLKEEAAVIRKTTDNNLFLIGYTESIGAGNRDIYLIKISPKGDVLWEKTYGGTGNDWASELIQTKNGEWLIFGTTDSYGDGGRDFYLIWINENGDLLRQKTHGHIDFETSADIVENEAGELYTFGYTTSYGAIGRDFYLLKLNAQGDSLWQQLYGGVDYEEPHTILQHPNGNILMHGHTATTDPNHNMYSVLVDTSGTILWERELGGNQHDGGQSALVNKNGNFILLGRGMSFGDQRQLLLTELSPENALLQIEDFGTPDNELGQDIIEVGDSYFIAGHTDHNSKGDNDFLLMKRLK